MKLIVTDIDNTVFDWVGYYVPAMSALFDVVSEKIGVPPSQLATEARDVFVKHGSIEYPFLIQELSSVNQFYGNDIDRMLSEVVQHGRDAFLKEAQKTLVPYEGVIQTFQQLRKNHPQVPICALTDAPRYIAMWKLNKLGILHFFDAVYGLGDPKVPTCDVNSRIKVDPEILFKHLQQYNFEFQGKIRILPDEYEKPGIRGLKTVLMDYGLDESIQDRHQVLWVGDNLRKDIGLGNKLGVVSVWAKYGTLLDPEQLTALRAFSPPQNIHKNVYLEADDPQAPKPDYVIDSFAELLKIKN